MEKVLIALALIALAYLLLVCINRKYTAAKVEVYNIPRNGKEWFVKLTTKTGKVMIRDFRRKAQAEAFAVKLKNAHYVI